MGEFEFGDMKLGLMCECGHIAPANDLWWGVHVEERKHKVPVIHLKCPECGKIDPCNVTFMVYDEV